MKKLIIALSAIASFMAFAEYQFVVSPGPSRGLAGNVVAFDVQSTNATQTATLKRVREISAYTNALDITTSIVTNKVYFPETVVTNGVTNIIQGVSNVVSSVTTTNGFKKVLAARQCSTNSIVSITCVNGFATTNINDWIVRDDAIIVDCEDKSVKATIIIKK